MLQCSFSQESLDLPVWSAYKSTPRPQETIQNALQVQSVKCLELSV